MHQLMHESIAYELCFAAISAEMHFQFACYRNSVERDQAVIDAIGRDHAAPSAEPTPLTGTRRARRKQG